MLMCPIHSNASIHALISFSFVRRASELQRFRAFTLSFPFVWLDIWCGTNCFCSVPLHSVKLIGSNLAKHADEFYEIIWSFSAGLFCLKIEYLCVCVCVCHMRSPLSNHGKLPNRSPSPIHPKNWSSTFIHDGS